MEVKIILILYHILINFLIEGVLAQFYKTVTGPMVTTKRGTVLGKTVITETGFVYDSFQGIPYGKPPIGQLRFQNPLPVEKWSGILNATKPKLPNSQYDFVFSNTIHGKEDCLYLNVFVPNIINKNKYFHVMVWIYGLGFVFGDANSFSPDYFVEKEVILVTLNYRVGVLGFLSLNIPEAPGNVGLKDQSLALKWIHENIHYFKGDNKKITIFGQGAGSASVHLHMLSPMSKDLFQNAILQSGTANSPWVINKHPEDSAFRLAEFLGSKSQDAGKVAAFLRTIPDKTLITAAMSMNLTNPLTLPFSPVIEKVFESTEAFLTQDPQQLLNSGNYYEVPTMIGLTEADGLIFRTAPFVNPKSTDPKYVDLTRFIPEEFIVKHGQNGLDPIIDTLEHYYFPTAAHISDDITIILSDYEFIKDTMKTIRAHVEFGTPTYFYRFSYSGSKNLLRITTNMSYDGSGHTDELGYMFNIDQLRMHSIPLTFEDEVLSERLLEMWTNFAKYSNPTPSSTEILPVIWPPIKTNKILCLDIGETLNVIWNPYVKVEMFWKRLYGM